MPGLMDRIVTSPGAMVTVLVAVFGQALFSIYFQITNNEQQSAQLQTNAQAIRDFREQVFSLNTPLATRVFKVEDGLEAVRRANEQTLRHIESIDTAGTRALALVAANQQRVMSQVDRLAERQVTMDKRIGDLDVSGSVNKLQNQIDIMLTTSKRLEEQQGRIFATLDSVNKQLQDLKLAVASMAHPPFPPP